ncbi:MAG: PsbP-related protein [Planctomycetota bacterium]|jgi:hypothetical protein
MRSFAVAVALLLLLTPVLAQQPPMPGSKKPVSYESKQYQVKIAGPEGWTTAWTGPKSSGNWVDLVRFEEPRTKAEVTLSTSATHHRSAKDMIAALKKQFQKDARLAIHRKEEMGPTSKRPRGILFEYTTQGKEGPIHAVAAYFHHLSRRYRVYAVVREVGWRTISDDVEKFAKGLGLTSRAFRDEKERRNYTDDAHGFAFYYPESWSVRVPAKGPRVVFNSAVGVEIRVYVTSSRENLVDSVDRVVQDLEARDAKDVKRGRPQDHAQGFRTVSLSYSITAKNVEFLYRETAIVHKNKLYRLVLVGAKSAIRAGEEPYARLIDSFTLK